METIIALWPYFLVALIGSTVHIIAKFADLEKEQRTFNASRWLKKNLWRTILGYCLAVGGVILLAELGQLSYGAVLLAGYTGDSLMKKGQKQA